MFGAPDVFAKLEKDPRTKDFAKDPSFVSTIKLLQANPNAIMQHLSDPRFSACINCFVCVYFPGFGWSRYSLEWFIFILKRDSLF